MGEMTQQDYDDSCDGFKLEVNNLVKKSGENSLSMAIAKGNKEITTMLYQFQEMINPAVNKLGLKTKSLSEIFGVEIKLTAY